MALGPDKFSLLQSCNVVAVVVMVAEVVVIVVVGGDVSGDATLRSLKELTPRRLGDKEEDDDKAKVKGPDSALLVVQWTQRQWKEFKDKIEAANVTEDDYPEARSKIPCNEHPMSDAWGAQFSQCQDGADERWQLLKKRVVQHNIKVISEYYEQIHTKRLCELVGLGDKETEEELSELVCSKFVYARIDRPAGTIKFGKKQTYIDRLNGWSDSITKMLDLVENTSHLIQKEQMIHAARAKLKTKKISRAENGIAYRCDGNMRNMRGLVVSLISFLVPMMHLAPFVPLVGASCLDDAVPPGQRKVLVNGNGESYPVGILQCSWAASAAGNILAATLVEDLGAGASGPHWFHQECCQDHLTANIGHVLFLEARAVGSSSLCFCWGCFVSCHLCCPHLFPGLRRHYEQATETHSCIVMAGFHYRMTFIDQIAEPQLELRSKSSPPVLKTRKQHEDVLENLRTKKQLTLQVSKLETRSQTLSSKISNASNSNASVSRTRRQVFSVGSYGHPNICRRPCILFAQGNCNKAENCGFCHLAHEEHMPTLDKQGREFLRDLPDLSFMEMVLPYFRKRVEDNELPGAERILQLLESEIVIRSRSKGSTGRMQIPRKIRYIVERMSLGRLVSLVCSTLGGKFPKLMSNELKDLRQTAKTLNL
eukprot:s447_g22.t1